MKNNSIPTGDQIADGLIKYLKEGNLFQTLPEIIKRLQQAAQENITEARVETAVALSPTEQKTVKELLEKQMGWKNEVKFIQNTELLGGMKITIGDKVLDLTVLAKLNNLYEQI
jgi:F-type H+-transporting ATPase subunit delta